MNDMNGRLSKRIEERNWKQYATGEGMLLQAKRCLNVVGDVTDATWDQDKMVKALRGNGLKDTTINTYLVTMDSLDFPVNYLTSPSKEPRVLTSTELETLDERVRAVEGWEHFKAFYGFLRDTGCRGIAEFGRLDWYEVDWQGRSCVLTSYKGSQVDRTVPLTDIALNSLSWLYRTHQYVNEAGWRRFWNIVRLDDSNRPYDLRHTYCTRLLDAGVAVETVSQIMGHSSLDMTMHYYHTTPKTLADAAKAIS